MILSNIKNKIVYLRCRALFKCKIQYEFGFFPLKSENYI